MRLWFCSSGQCTRRCVYLNGTLVLHKVKDGAAVEYECLARQGSYVSSPVSASVFLASMCDGELNVAF